MSRVWWQCYEYTHVVRKCILLLIYYTTCPDQTKRLADFRQRDEGDNNQKDSLHQLARSEQTTIFRLRTDHCRHQRHMKQIDIVRADWKHKPQSMSCSHALFTKKKEKVSSSVEQPTTYAWWCGSWSPWRDYTYDKTTRWRRILHTQRIQLTTDIKVQLGMDSMLNVCLNGKR